ncbi:ferritin [Candidatus Peregrinibacteria bacterium]|nr:ferritin [Candidatus Peregrinibacteria bacterium]MBT4056298.1 ferritin [Candidatus Peregrinibacteria bacterium]
MMDKTLLKEMNKQIQEELYSAYLYLAMSAYLEGEALPGAAHWMQLQQQEETMHGMKFFNYIQSRGDKVELLELEKPPKAFGELVDVFKASLEHEQHITARINTLYELAVKVKDYSAQTFLSWFVDEQVEEEGNAQGVLDKLEKVGDSKEGAFFIDNELGKRVAGGTEE